MLAQTNRELIRRIIEGWNGVHGDAVKKRSLFDKYYAPGFTYHDISTGDTDREQTVQDMVSYLAAFPDANYSIDDLLADKDKTAIRCTLRATHKGTFMGITAAGMKIVVNQVEIHKIADGKILEAWGFSDSHGMMSQLGIKPSSSPK